MWLSIKNTRSLFLPRPLKNIHPTERGVWTSWHTYKVDWGSVGALGASWCRSPSSYIGWPPGRPWWSRTLYCSCSIRSACVQTARTFLPSFAPLRTTSPASCRGCRPLLASALLPSTCRLLVGGELVSCQRFLAAAYTYERLVVNGATCVWQQARVVSRPRSFRSLPWRRIVGLFLASHIRGFRLVSEE